MPCLTSWTEQPSTRLTTTLLATPYCTLLRAAETLVIVRVLLTAGADPLARNAKGRTPGKQLKINEDVRTELEAAAAAQRADKDAARSAVWSEALKKTQTDSAFGLQTL